MRRMLGVTVLAMVLTVGALPVIAGQTQGGKPFVPREGTAWGDISPGGGRVFAPVGFGMAAQSYEEEWGTGLDPSGMFGWAGPMTWSPFGWREIGIFDLLFGLPFGFFFFSLW